MYSEYYKMAMVYSFLKTIVDFETNEDLVVLGTFQINRNIETIKDLENNEYIDTNEGIEIVEDQDHLRL